jgi:hypothetical protein
MKYNTGSEVYNKLGHVGKVIAYYNGRYIVEFQIEVEDCEGSFFDNQLSYKYENELTDNPLKFVQHLVAKQLESVLVELREDIKNLETRKGIILMDQLTAMGSLSLSYQCILKSLENSLDNRVGYDREQKIQALNELTKVVHKVDTAFGLVP